MKTTPLIAAQPGIYIADKLSSFDNTFVVAHYLVLRGILNVEILEDAIMQGMAETDTLQMKFCDLDGEAVQVSEGSSSLPQPKSIDLRHETDPSAVAHKYINENVNVNTRVDGGNVLIQHTILQTGDNEWIWYQRYHHLHVDAYSFTALTRRMCDLYSARMRNTVADPRTFTPIVEAVKEYQAYEKSPKYAKDVAFWKKYCSELPPAHSLKPLPGANPSKNVVRSGVHTMNHDDFAKLCEYGPAADMALGLVALWLMRLCNCDAMSLGFIFMRRLGSAALNTAGPFINVLPMAVSGKSILEISQNIQKSLKLIRRYQKMNSEQIVRDNGRSWDSDPLFGPVINFKAFDYQLDLEGLECDTHHLASGPIRDLEIVIYVDEQQHLTVEYLANADRYSKSSIDTHFQRLDQLLNEIAHGNEESIVLPQELNLINSVNNTTVKGYENKTLVSMIREQNPTAVALRDTLGNNLTYAEMSQRVQRLASGLYTKVGVQKGDIVAVKLPRSLELSLALQAVVSLGAAYLPLDPGYPEERIQMMIEDAKPKLIITVDNIDSLSSEVVQTSEPSPADIAYIIFTSGSTGRPKGVMVSHEAIVNRLCWMQNEYNLSESDVILQKTPSSFDVSVWEFFWPLISGASCLMAPPDAHRDPEQIRQIVLEFGVTTIHFVPSMLSTFLGFSDGVSKSLLRTFCSGEALPVDLAKAWQQQTGVPLYNLYGPTEAAIDVTSYPAFGKAIEDISASVPIGFPVWNTQMYVLDNEMRLLPPGIAGNLYIGGVQLARGYLNREELTSERFIFWEGRRLYCTGDLAKWLDNGALEFLGRNDEQVKIRGQRIELGEIDTCMSSLDGVKQAVTHPQVIGGANSIVDSRQLVGYLVAPSDFDVDKAHAELSKVLPSYMVPVKFVILDSMPLTPTGKLARNKLPAVDSMPRGPGKKPSPGIEQTVARIYESLLGISDVSADDDFFTLGGHSLLAVKLASELRKQLQRPVTIGQVMQSPRVDLLAAQIKSNDDGDNAGFEDVFPLRPTEHGPKLFCIHPASGFAWQFSVLRRYLDPQWSLIGIQSTRPDGAMGSAENLTDVVNTHYKTITDYDPTGPYYLLGYSLGGTLAHSLAAKLKREGKQVNFVGLLDTWPPETQNWDAKRGENVLDQAVVDEMNRERQQFLTINLDDGFSTRMFDAIEANYSTAVRLLVTARSQRYEGNTVLFVAQRTLPPGTDLQEVWRPFTQSLTTVGVDSSHIDIIHPQTFKSLGPKINTMLAKAHDQM